MAKNPGISNLNEVREQLAEQSPALSVVYSEIDTDFPVSDIFSTDQARWIDYPNYSNRIDTTVGVQFAAEILPPNVYVIDRSDSTTNLTTISFASRLAHGLLGDQVDVKLFMFDTVLRDTQVVSSDIQRIFTFTSNVPINTINTPFTSKLYVGSTEITGFTLNGLTVTLDAPVAIGVELTLLLAVDARPTIIQLNDPSDYVVINNELIHWTYDIATWVPASGIAFVVIQPMLPRYSKYAPIRIINNHDKSIVKSLNRWDPKFNLHSRSINQIDVTSDTDPAIYSVDKLATSDGSPGNQWTSHQQGTYWWATNTRLYRPYNDTHIASFDQATSSWGQLHEGTELVVYQWVASNKQPSAIKDSTEPYSRILSKTRKYNDVVLWDAGTTQTVFTSLTPILFTTGKLVSVYERVGTAGNKVPTGITLGLPYVITVLTPTTFILETEAGDPVISSTTPVGDFRIADSDWDAYPSIVEPPITERFYCFDNSVFPNTYVNPKFYFQHPTMIRRLPDDDNVIVWVNGLESPYVLDQDDLSVTILNDVGEPSTDLGPQDIIDVRLLEPTPTIRKTTTDLIDTNNMITYYVRDFPYSERDDGVTTTYYFWIRKYDVIPTGKTLTTTDVELDLAMGDSREFFVLRNPNRTTTGEFVYDIITTKGLFDLNSPKPHAYSIALDLDPNIRARYESDTNQKVAHDQWVLFRPKQKNKILPAIWARITQTISGINSDGEIVPSSSRATYDFLNSTQTQYGSGHDQVMFSTTEARELFLDYMRTASLVTEDRYTILEILARPLNTPHDYNSALLMMYQACFPSTINDLTFLIINVAMYKGHELVDLMKTSYISLNASQEVILG
jgi:hypothetical protein